MAARQTRELHWRRAYVAVPRLLLRLDSGSRWLLVSTIGVAGLIQEWRAPAPNASTSLHVLFGGSLCLWVLTLPLQSNAASAAAQLRALRRRQSRLIYLMLYSLVGVHQFLLLSLTSDSESVRLPAPVTLRDYLLAGVVALIAVHLSSAYRLHRLEPYLNARRPPVSRKNPVAVPVSDAVVRKSRGAADRTPP
jgi:hypothetical protein